MGQKKSKFEVAARTQYTFLLFHWSAMISGATWSINRRQHRGCKIQSTCKWGDMYTPKKRGKRKNMACGTQQRREMRGPGQTASPSQEHRPHHPPPPTTTHNPPSSTLHLPPPPPPTTQSSTNTYRHQPPAVKSKPKSRIPPPPPTTTNDPHPTNNHPSSTLHLPSPPPTTTQSTTTTYHHQPPTVKSKPKSRIPPTAR